MWDVLGIFTVGSTIGFIAAYVWLRWLGGDITKRTYKETLKAQEELINYQKRVINQLKGRLRTAEYGLSPNEWSNLNLDDLLNDPSQLMGLLENIRLPKILQPFKPFIPTIIEKLKENPELLEKVKEKLSSLTKGKVETGITEGI